jgi:hypothetical protein
MRRVNIPITYNDTADEVEAFNDDNSDNNDKYERDKNDNYE